MVLSLYKSVHYSARGTDVHVWYISTMREFCHLSLLTLVLCYLSPFIMVFIEPTLAYVMSLLPRSYLHPGPSIIVLGGTEFNEWHIPALWATPFT